jgi:acyl-CoA dehydrogenase
MVLDETDAAFRDEVRRFLAEALTDELRAAGRRCSGIFTDYPEGIRWHRILAQRGWSVPHWPLEHGGTGWSPIQHYLFATELALADAPPLAPMGTHMVGPVIVAFGTPEQQQRWLPGIRSGDDYWAQGYSEPQAGSDLASLQCRAVRDGDEYVVNGTKIWTTHAQFANKMFCLVRTLSGTKPQQGISFLCFDLKRPGITVRPIISISGDHELNQVFFDDVRVPASGLIGDENAGWTIAKYLLQHERGGAWAPGLRARLRRLRGALDDAFALQPPGSGERSDLQLKLADAECRIDAVEALELRALQAQTRGEAPGIRPSVGKVLGAETRQRLTELGIQIAAHYGSVRLPLALCGGDADAGGDGLPVPEDSVFGMSAYLNDRAASIYAGTNEVQRNLIAAHLLAA